MGSKEELSERSSDPVIETNDPLKTDPQLKIYKKIVSHCCLVITILAFQYVLLGICAIVLSYKDKGHLIAFAAISGLQLVCAPLGWYGIKSGNRLFLTILAVVNVIWIIAAIIMLLVYWLIIGGESFRGEIALHVGAFVFIVTAFVLAVTTYLLMKRLDMVNITIDKPKIKLSPEGKASKK